MPIRVWKLDNIGDVDMPSPTGGQVPVWNATEEKWKAANAASISGILVGPTITTLSADEAATNATTVIKITPMDTVVGIGLWVFEYYVRMFTSDTSNSCKFSVNHTGTTPFFLYTLRYPSSGSIAATGGVSQDQNTATGNLVEHQSTRAKHTTLGPQATVDAANGSLLYRISGMMEVTVSGTLELYVASESNLFTVTPKSGTTLLLTKTG